MCLAVPGKVISIDNSDPELKMAKVSFGGIIREICVQWIDDLKTGEYVMAHVGVALTKVNEEDAIASLQALRDIGELDFEEDLIKIH